MSIRDLPDFGFTQNVRTVSPELVNPIPTNPARCYLAILAAKVHSEQLDSKRSQ
jgi:hypothetical protein